MVALPSPTRLPGEDQSGMVNKLLMSGVHSRADLCSILEQAVHARTMAPRSRLAPCPLPLAPNASAPPMGTPSLPGVFGIGVGGGWVPSCGRASPAAEFNPIGSEPIDAC